MISRVCVPLYVCVSYVDIFIEVMGKEVFRLSDAAVTAWLKQKVCTAHSAHNGTI